MRTAVTALDEYYDKVFHSQDIPTPGPSEPHPRFFTYPTKFQEYLVESGRKSETADGARPELSEFQYIEPLHGDPTNATFLAKVKSSDRKLVIKFVDRYGVEAHQLLADEKMAPQLLYCGLLDGMSDVRIDGSRTKGSTKIGGLYVGPMRMVVMECIERDTVEPFLPDDARKKVEEVVKKLHEAKFVFGDLRAPNIIFPGDRPFLIDFDWGGKEGEARYPRNLSGSVRWPRDASELEMKPILMDHDRFMLGQLFLE